MSKFAKHRRLTSLFLAVGLMTAPVMLTADNGTRFAPSRADVIGSTSGTGSSILPPDFSGLASEEFILHVSTISSQSRRNFDEAERHLRRLEELYDAPNPTTIKLRAESWMGRGDHFGAASAFELWLEMIGVDDMGDPLEARIEETRSRFMDSLGPRMIGLRRTRASQLIQQGQYSAALELLETTSQLGVRDWTQDLSDASVLLVSRQILQGTTEEARLTLERCRRHLSTNQFNQFERAIRVRVAADLASAGNWNDAYQRLVEAEIRTGASEVLNRAMQQAMNARFIQAAEQNAWERCRAIMDEAQRNGLTIAPAFQLALIIHEGVDQSAESEMQRLISSSLESIPGCAPFRMERAAVAGQDLASVWESTGQELRSSFQVVERERNRIATLSSDFESTTQSLGGLTSDLATLRREVADAKTRDEANRTRRANVEREINNTRSRIQELERREQVANTASTAQTLGGLYAAFGGPGGQDLNRAVRAGSAVAGAVEQTHRSTEELQRARAELSELEDRLISIPSNSNDEEVAQANLQAALNRESQLQEREQILRSEIQASRQALQEAEEAYPNFPRSPSRTAFFAPLVVGIPRKGCAFPSQNPCSADLLS